jgi:hypothetical protein
VLTVLVAMATGELFGSGRISGKGLAFGTALKACWRLLGFVPTSSRRWTSSVGFSLGTYATSGAAVSSTVALGRLAADDCQVVITALRLATGTAAAESGNATDGRARGGMCHCERGIARHCTMQPEPGAGCMIWSTSPSFLGRSCTGGWLSGRHWYDGTFTAMPGEPCPEYLVEHNRAFLGSRDLLAGRAVPSLLFGVRGTLSSAG